ncbi:hypothetical protein KFE25_013102 [Diacronema lutheri]|uniref:TIR domain-containing protein n=1 Tax=Diacronema lutheri TaxID=2081491 RepID=A0A8J5XBH4_DIALT|nr:hypothetical protein KFE25_013102 [Diacronema lutheri]
MPLRSQRSSACSSAAADNAQVPPELAPTAARASAGTCEPVMHVHELGSGTALAGQPEAQAALRVAARAQLGTVDAFISHSWHDDAQQKFDAVQAWRARFVNAHGREPTVWFDALCIDQDNVQPQLASLPIYLAGCKTVLALAGPTYFQRLWCVLELHIFHQMGGSIEQIHFVPLETVAPTAGDVGAEEAANEAAVFDVRCAVATDPLDELRLLAVIEGSGEGIAAFNSWVRTTLMSAAKVRH